MALRDWLSAVERDPSPSEQFSVCDVSEHATPEPDQIRALATAVLEAKTSLAFLQEIAPLLGWGLASARAASIPRPSVRRGDFGEVLSTEWLDENDRLFTPVSKLRSQILASQTQPGVDQVAVEMGGDSIARLHLVETKLRTTRNTSAAIEAYAQHANRSTSDVDALLIFILERLWERDDPMFELLTQHLMVRSDKPDDAYHVVLIYDTDSWSERTLERLADVAGTLLPLRVHVIRIEGLAQLVDSVFASLAIEVLHDPEDIEESGVDSTDV